MTDLHLNNKNNLAACRFGGAIARTEVVDGDSQDLPVVNVEDEDSVASIFPQSDVSVTELARLRDDDTVSEAELVRMSLNRNAVFAVVQNPNCPPSVATRLSTYDDPEYRRAAAKCFNAPKSVLTRLSLDEDSSVRHMVAENRRTPVSVLDELSTDVDDIVRLRVVGNPKTPIMSLIK